MAKASVELINALRKTADSLKKGAPYQWGHMGSCNCGNLAQQLTGLSGAEIHERPLKVVETGMINAMTFVLQAGYLWMT